MEFGVLRVECGVCFAGDKIIIEFEHLQKYMKKSQLRILSKEKPQSNNRLCGLFWFFLLSCRYGCAKLYKSSPQDFRNC